MINKTNVTLLLAFAFVFGAGAVIGIARQSGVPSGRTHGSWLSKELNLTPEQHKQMKAIWSEVMSNNPNRDSWDQRKLLQKQRDQAVQSLLNSDQKLKYDEINKQYEDQVAALNQSCKKAFEDATAKTRGILTPEQVELYDQFLKRRGRGGAPRPFGNGSNAPVTQPVEANPH
jgi:Spy/CpxP family protein refolding chaperone